MVIWITIWICELKRLLQLAVLQIETKKQQIGIMPRFISISVDWWKKAECRLYEECKRQLKQWIGYGVVDPRVLVEVCTPQVLLVGNDFIFYI